MSDNQYIYAVARIRSRELDLLGDPFINQLLSCKDYAECIKLLTEKGWGKTGNESAAELLDAEMEKTWNLMKELVEDMSVFDILVYQYDFHNLKAAIKQVYLNSEVPDIYNYRGTVAPESILTAIKEKDFEQLPAYLRECAAEAYEVQMHTGDSQLCDAIIDRAALDAIVKKAGQSDNELFADYAEHKCAAASIKIAFRGLRTGKSREFLERAIPQCNSIDRDKLIEAAVAGESEIYSYLETTSYEKVVSEIKKSPSAFERWFDNLLISNIRPQKYNPFTVSPLAAYILARENEIRNVRIILSGKLNGLSDDSIRDRMREMYV